MKSIKLLATFLILAIALVACLAITGIVGSSMASDAFVRVGGLIGVTFAAAVTVYWLLKPARPSDDASGAPGPGPKF